MSSSDNSAQAQANEQLQQQQQRPQRSVIDKVELSDNDRERFHGVVKYFKGVYGFATVVDGQYAGRDVIIHQKNLLTNNECYRTLYKGEHVEFSINEVENERIEAVDVSAPGAHCLMCETNPMLGRRRQYNGHGRGGYNNRGRSNGRGNGRGRNTGPPRQGGNVLSQKTSASA